MAKVNNFSVLMGGVVTALTTVSIEDQFSIGHDVDYDEKKMLIRYTVKFLLRDIKLKIQCWHGCASQFPRESAGTKRN